jgi:hypothetical protein
MLPLDVVTAIAVVIGGSCCFDVVRRLRRPGLVPPRDWVVNIETSALSLSVSIMLVDVIAHLARDSRRSGAVESVRGPDLNRALATSG